MRETIAAFAETESRLKHLAKHWDDSPFQNLNMRTGVHVALEVSLSYPMSCRRFGR